MQSDEKALSETLDWLIKLDSSSFSLAQGIARDLWTIVISRDRGLVTTAVATLLEKLGSESQTFRTVFAAWQRSSEKPDFVAVTLGKSKVLSDVGSGTCTLKTFEWHSSSLGSIASRHFFGSLNRAGRIYYDPASTLHQVSITRTSCPAMIGWQC